MTPIEIQYKSIHYDNITVYVHVTRAYLIQSSTLSVAMFPYRLGAYLVQPRKRNLAAPPSEFPRIFAKLIFRFILKTTSPIIYLYSLVSSHTYSSWRAMDRASQNDP